MNFPSQYIEISSSIEVEDVAEMENEIRTPLQSPLQSPQSRTHSLQTPDVTIDSTGESTRTPLVRTSPAETSEGVPSTVSSKTSDSGRYIQTSG